jgi:phosphohistidine phosphatase
LKRGGKKQKMDLILWRHADAHGPQDGLSDDDRPLTKKGQRQARLMGAWLQQHLPSTAKVLVSPTLRTRQTAETLEHRCRVLPALGPDGTVDGLLLATRWPSAAEPVVVVGHQLTLGMTAAYLLAGVVQPWPVRNAAVWWLRRRVRDGQVQVVLHTVLSVESL